MARQNFIPRPCPVPNPQTRHLAGENVLVTGINGNQQVGVNSRKPFFS